MFAELKSPQKLRKTFRKKYFTFNPRQALYIKTFDRFIDTSDEYGTVQQLPVGDLQPILMLKK